MIFKKKDSKEVFWNWFLKNKSKLEDFISSERKDYSIYNQLTKELQKYNNLLYPELTIDKDKNFILIITPDGIKDGLIPTKEIAEFAPEIKGWKVKKFRQARDKITLNFNGLEFLYEDIKIFRKFNLEDEKVNIAVLIKNYNKEDNRYKALGFLYLDHILGEFNVLTRIGEIEFFDWDMLNDEVEAIDLLTLKKEITEKLY